MTPPHSLTIWQKIAITLLMAFVLWVPRGLILNRFVAVDERSWLTRSGNFYLALNRGDFADTFQRYHPGVTTMWLGAAAYLWRYPGYAKDAASQIEDMSEGVEGFLRTHGYEPIDLLAGARNIVVLVTIGVLLISFWVAADLFGLPAALVAFLLISFEPFLLGLTRMLHVDGLASVFMFLALLSYLRYFAGATGEQPSFSGRRRDLVLSGIAAGLAWLSKSPAFFLIPFMGLVSLYAAWQSWRAARAQNTGGVSTIVRPALAGLLWLGVAALCYVLFWPAMWVHPVESLRAVFSAAGDSAAAGHAKALYFNGRAYLGDPGIWFYPYTFLWRVSPLTLLGIPIAVAAWPFKLPPLNAWGRRVTLVWLGIFSLLFTVAMTFGATKFPRYLLPVYMPLTLVAGVGWMALAQWLGRLFQRRWLVAVIVSLPLLAQAAIAASVFPYYFTYYNPLLGGAKRAPQVMMIGLGEGLDEAARYLRKLPGAEDNTVATWYRGGSFNYFYPYDSVDIDRFYQSDYAVIYAHQWQREVPDKRLLDYFATLMPEHVVTLNGTEYARIYDMRTAPPPNYFIDWVGAIRLVDSDILPETVQAGDALVVRLHFLSTATLERNLNVLVRLVDERGQEVARSEGWPFGTPTSTWEPGQVYVDGHDFVIPADTERGYLRVEVEFYDPTTQEVIPPTNAASGELLPDLMAVDYVTVAPLPAPTPPFKQPIQLGDQIALSGATLNSAAADVPGELTVPARPGDSLPLTLVWHMNQYVPVDYTVLVQLIDASGQLAAQWDSQPLNGVLPTSLWRSGGDIVDRHQVTLPNDLPGGEYRLIIGMYDLATLERLPVSISDEPAGDTIPIASVVVNSSE